MEGGTVMETIVSLIFALVSLAIVLSFLPEIIGLGAILLAMYYLVSFAGGLRDGKK